MSNKVLVKKSSVVGKVPLTSDLDYGELALNYTDGKLYYKTSTNSISSIGTASQTQIDRKAYVATAGQTVFNVNYSEQFVDVYVNGSHLTSTTDYTATSSTNITLVVACSSGDQVDLIGYGGVSASTREERFTVTATSGQTSLTVADDSRVISYTPMAVDVYLNGLKMVNGSDVIVTSGSAVVFVSALVAGDSVDIVASGSFQVADTVSKSLGGTFLGKVGIGVTPTHTLDVNSGSDWIPGRFASTSTATVVTFADSTTTGLGPFVGSTGNALIIGRAGVAEYVRVDASGRVTMPYQPAFLARYSTNKVKPAGWNLFPSFDYTDFNVGSHFSANIFTAPVAGLYCFVSGGFIVTASTGDTRVAIALQRNNSDYTISGGQLSAGDTPFPLITFLAKASAGDTFRLQAYSPIDITLGSGNSYSFTFAGYLVS